jgi:acyl transferase domain-containing protein
MEHRGAVVAAGHGELLDGLRALASGEPAPGVVRGVAGSSGKVAFLFTGQGAQRPGMGEELYAAFPVFAEAYDQVLEHLDIPTTSAETGFAQPALFAVEVALFRLVQSWGVRPDFLSGHSIGELAAAHVAGVWSLADAARVVAARARLMQALPPGVVVAVRASEAEVQAAIEAVVGAGAARSSMSTLRSGPEPGLVGVARPVLGSVGRSRSVLVLGSGGWWMVAAVNGPRSVVISGDETAVLAVASRFEHRRLAVSHAFHSAHLDPILGEFRTVLESVSYASPSIPLVTASAAGADHAGRIGVGDVCSPEYWVRQVRETVRFADGVTALADQGVTRFLELGPDGVLSALGPEMCRGRVRAGAARGPRRGTHRHHRARQAARLRVAVDWSSLVAGGRRVDLPTYAFQRERFWPTPAVTVPQLYRVSWERTTPPDDGSPTRSRGTWLVVVPAGRTDDDLVRQLRPGNVVVPLGESIRDLPEIPDLAEVAGVLSLATREWIYWGSSRNSDVPV